MNQNSRLACWFIRAAARAAPAALAERLEEEWLADLDSRPSALSRLRFAIGCFWAIQVISFENRSSRVVVAHGVASGKSMALPEAFGQISRRSTTFLLVASLHVALFYLLISAVTRTHPQSIPAPLQNNVLDLPRPVALPRTEAPVWPMSTLTMPPPEDPHLPPVENDADHLFTTTDMGAALPRLPEVPQIEPEPAHAAKLIQGGPGAGFPNPDDFYPPISKRYEEQGIATVQVCVDAQGWLTTAPVTVHSSGSARLDQGAVKLALAASGRYRASTEDGRPVSSCYPFRVRFQIKN